MSTNSFCNLALQVLEQLNGSSHPRRSSASRKRARQRPPDSADVVQSIAEEFTRAQTHSDRLPAFALPDPSANPEQIAKALRFYRGKHPEKTRAAMEEYARVQELLRTGEAVIVDDEE
jgi:hypothetical protein